MLLAKWKFVLAVLSIVLLLANPAGFCAGNMTSTSGGHPCCPKAPSAKASCLCIDRQPAAPSVIVVAEIAPLVAEYVAAPAVSLEMATPAIEAPPGRAVTFHQLLI
jgi:hypothetical protein